LKPCRITPEQPCPFQIARDPCMRRRRRHQRRRIPHVQRQRHDRVAVRIVEGRRHIARGRKRDDAIRIVHSAPIVGLVADPTGVREGIDGKEAVHELVEEDVFAAARGTALAVAGDGAVDVGRNQSRDRRASEEGPLDDVEFGVVTGCTLVTTPPSDPGRRHRKQPLGMRCLGVRRCDGAMEGRRGTHGSNPGCSSRAA
jgi:hypothetical protein